MFRTIRSRIIAIIVVFLAMLLGMVYFNLEKGFDDIAKSSSTGELNKLNAMLFEGLKVAMNTGDPLVIGGFIEGAKKVPGIVHLGVYPSKKFI